MNRVELASREEILYENYAKIVNIEALTMVEMACRDIIPAVTRYIKEVSDAALSKVAFAPETSVAMEKDTVCRLSELNEKAYALARKLAKLTAAAAEREGARASAESYRDKVIPTMEALRELVDEMETLTASDAWPLPSYGDMTFGE